MFGTLTVDTHQVSNDPAQKAACFACVAPVGAKTSVCKAFHATQLPNVILHLLPHM
jgi:hypothetical protein